MSSETVDGTVFHAHDDSSQTSPLIVHDEIKREVLDTEQAIVPLSHAENGVQDSVPWFSSCIEFVSFFSSTHFSCVVIASSVECPSWASTSPS